jgi:hypothetical protein
VIEHSEWIPRWSSKCSHCSGAGKIEEEYISERYPSGKPAAYGRRKVQCRSCSGSGTNKGGGYYHKTYSPDYHARQGGKSSGCFLTSACLGFTEAPESERLLTVLRGFRDNYVLTQPGGGALIAEYYYFAPKIVEAIDRSDDPAAVYRELYRGLVLPCVDAVEAKRHAEALARYKEILRELQERFLQSATWGDGEGI